MTVSITLSIDGRPAAVPPGASVLDACDRVGVYVPRLCAFPGLPAVGDCGLCFVSIDGEARRACAVPAADGMSVLTDDEEARSFRRSSMAAILGDHPHVCLTCPQRDGCSREECTYGLPPTARCCDALGWCEIGRVAAYVGALEAAPPYRFRALGSVVERNLRRDLDLCVGCGRCVAACDTLPEAGRALRLVETKPLVGGDASAGVAVAEEGDGGPDAWQPQSYLGRHVVAPQDAAGLRASGCTFCAACVLVCPSGALTAAGPAGPSWRARRRQRTTLRPPVLPPDGRLAFAETTIDQVPAHPGVFSLLDGGGEVLQISGVGDLRAGLREAARSEVGRRAAWLAWEEQPLYTQRESELLARHLHQFGALPPGNDGPSGLFEDDDEPW